MTPADRTEALAAAAVAPGLLRDVGPGSQRGLGPLRHRGFRATRTPRGRRGGGGPDARSRLRLGLPAGRVPLWRTRV